MNSIDADIFRRLAAVTEEHWQLCGASGTTPAQADAGDRHNDSEIPEVADLGYN